MIARYRITERDYVRAMRLFSRRSVWRELVFVALGIFPAAAVALWSTDLRPLGIGLLIFVIAMRISLHFRLPQIARRHYRQYPAMRQEFAIELLDTGVRFASPHGEGVLVWEHVLKWRQNDDYVLIYPMPRLFHVVPKTLAAQGFDIDALTARLGERVGKAS